MPKYDYGTVSNDQEKREEISQFLTSLGNFLDSMPVPANGEIPKGVLSGSERKRLSEVIADMREAMEGDPPEYKVTYSDSDKVTSFTAAFDRTVDFMRGRLTSMHSFFNKTFEEIRNLPGADAFFDGIGMSEPGTAGYYFDIYADGQTFNGAYKSNRLLEVDGISINQVLYGSYVLMEMTGGGENWRDVKIDDKEMERLHSEITSQFDRDGFLQDRIFAKDDLAEEITQSLFSSDPKKITAALDKEYFTDIAPRLAKKTRDDYQVNLSKYKKEPAAVEATFQDRVLGPLKKSQLVDVAYPVVMQANIATDKSRGFKSYLDVRKEERKYSGLYEKHFAETPVQKMFEELAEGKLFDTILPPSA